MSKNTFLLGVGGQKCGTSWLHDMISQSPSVDMGVTKEYHFHDARTLPECARFKQRLQKRMAGLKAKGLENTASPRLKLILDFHRDENQYYDYFKERLATPDIGVTGDFTPSYSGLSEATFRDIDARVAERGMTTKVVFLMRDPVERVWSAVRMSRREFLKKRPGHIFIMSEIDQIRDRNATSAYQLRSDYSATLKTLEAVFPADRLFFEFYENLFSQDVIDRLCKFVDIAPIQADLEKKVNASPKGSSLPDDVSEEIAMSYVGVYKDVANRFGTEKIKNLWQSARFVL